MATSEEVFTKEAWAWWDSATQSYQHIYPERFQVVLCFGGHKVPEAETRGEGKILPVLITYDESRDTKS